MGNLNFGDNVAGRYRIVPEEYSNRYYAANQSERARNHEMAIVPLRVLEAELFGMELQAVSGDACGTFGIEFITQYDMPQHHHMYSQLMCAPGPWAKPYPCGVFFACHDFPIGLGGATIFPIDALARAAFPVGGNWHVDMAAVALHLAPHAGDI